tara:strand:+ start:854 stop:1444 length:591 start_codon:yes stop_codon:yes gene_type:complete
MENDFKGLIDKVKSCCICEPFLPFGPNPVFQIKPDARILIVGQAPGRRVHETGIPFNDPSGDRLRHWMGVNRKTFYDENLMAILPMGFCYPGTGKSGDLPPRPECALHWRERLLASLPHIQLTLVIGQYAINYHLKGWKSQTLTETVKKWRDFWPEIVPLPHPSPRNNIWIKRNDWFEKEVLPDLRAKVFHILKQH